MSDELQEDELIGNTNLTVREFNKIIKTKTTEQLRNKVRLGGGLIDKLKGDEDPRARESIRSLKKQMRLLKRELRKREKQETATEETENKPPPTGPFNQVVGVKSLEISGSARIGS